MPVCGRRNLARRCDSRSNLTGATLADSAKARLGSHVAAARGQRRRSYPHRRRWRVAVGLGLPSVLPRYKPRSSRSGQFLKVATGTFVRGTVALKHNGDWWRTKLKSFVARDHDTKRRLGAGGRGLNRPSVWVHVRQEEALVQVVAALSSAGTDLLDRPGPAPTPG